VTRFPAAPWPGTLKATSWIATAVLGAASYALVKAIPGGARHHSAETFGTFMAFVPLLIALVAVLYVVTAYDVEGAELRVRRLLWPTRVPLEGITRAWHDPEALKGSIRIFGNGGLYSVTGLFQSRRLGRYRAFVTDPSRAVVLKLPKRTVVISPADPEAFLQLLPALVPGVRTEAAP
jgi:hypothetical protein